MSDQLIIAWIRWFDASYQRGECSLDELVTDVEVESAGLLIHEDEESVSLALDSYPADSVYRYIEHIPRVNIREIRKMPIPEN
jgi:hypothetical protein